MLLWTRLISSIISHLFRLPFANFAAGLALAFAPNSSTPNLILAMDHATRTSTSSASSTRVVDVLVPVALNQTYSYRVPRGMELKPGDVVCVPLGPREVVAVVWAENANPDPRLHNRLKDVGEKLDVPPLKEELRALVDWVANYTLSARGMVLRMTLADGRKSRARADAAGRAAGRRAAAAHDAGAAAADRGAVGRPAARQIRSGARKPASAPA